MESPKLTLILGPMFSGKSTALIENVRKYEAVGCPVLVIKPMIDQRYTKEDKVVTHRYDSISCSVASKLEAFDNNFINTFDIIAIDEGQFFPDLVPMVVQWLEILHKSILVAGLDGDYQRQPIGQILNLIPYADHYTKKTALCAVCKNGTPGQFTKRIVSGDKKVLIGGVECYKAVCRAHFYFNLVMFWLNKYCY